MIDQPKPPKIRLREVFRAMLAAADNDDTGGAKKTSMPDGLIISVTKKKAGPKVYYKIELYRHEPQLVSLIELKTVMRHMPEDMVILTPARINPRGYSMNYMRQSHLLHQIV